MGAKRVYRGLFSGLEQALIKRYVARIPGWVTPDHLSFISILGACLAGCSVVLAWKSPHFLALFLLGMFLHWFGDSFDGALARHRRIERPKAGLLIDRGADVFSYIVIIGGLGLSPYLTPIAALLLLVGTLVNAVYAMLLNLTDKEQVIGIGGLGGTEGRLILILWVLGCNGFGFAMQENPLTGLGYVEAISAALLMLAINTYATDLLRRIELHSRRELAHNRVKDSAIGAEGVADKAREPVEPIFVSTAHAARTPPLSGQHAVAHRSASRGNRRMRV